MADQHPAITARVQRFIEDQRMFFVATAAADGRVNLSPKGLDSLRILSANQIAWINGTGSGNETAAHVLATGRMTLMWCGYEGNPWIVRAYGTARMIQPNDPDWDEWAALFPPVPGSRQVFVLDVDLVQTSCGFAVPLYEYVGQRDLLHQWAEKKGPDGLAAYQHEKNRVSIDGLPTGLG